MSAPERPGFTVRRLAWEDEPIGTIPLPKAPLNMVMGLGSGLTQRPTDPPGVFWAVGDRGPNIKPKTLIERYGLDSVRELAELDGAKVMPCPAVGPTIAKLRIEGDRVELLELLPILASHATQVSGLPNPSSEHARCEPAFDLDGRSLDPDPSGLDSEGIAGLADGGFWVGDEFGPSLVRLDAKGRIIARHVPEGVELDGAGYPITPSLPAIAAKRQLNRGFEAIALSPDEKWLYLAFQSPLAHPDQAAHEKARHTRIWQLDATTLEVAAQFSYPFDDPSTFVRDATKDDVEWDDLKVSELLCLAEEDLLVLERCSETTKIYRVSLDGDRAIPDDHLHLATRPTLEELSPAGSLPQLDKRLLFNSDEALEVCADLEGMIALTPTQLLLVNDNDFGVEQARTEFWLVTFDEPVLA